MAADHDEIREALRRYVSATPFGDHATQNGSGPVGDFPPLPRDIRTNPLHWVRMMRALTRLHEFPTDPADTLAFEAATYLAQHAGDQPRCPSGRLACQWVTVFEACDPPHQECAYCGTVQP